MSEEVSVFEIPMFVLTMGLEGTSSINELHIIANELGLIGEKE
jgi:hypothetical protein